MTTNVLDQPTLVLNRQWQPVHVTTVARSLILLWNDAARVVDPEEYRLLSWSDWAEREPDDGEPCIRSARLRLRVPEVICLAHYDRLPSTAVTFSRRNVAKRDHYTCQYCGAQPGAESITIDHVAAAFARGNVDLDQLRGRLRAVQRPEGRPHSRAGRHAAPSPAGPPRVEAVLRRAGCPDRELGQVPDAMSRPWRMA